MPLRSRSQEELLHQPCSGRANGAQNAHRPRAPSATGREDVAWRGRNRPAPVAARLRGWVDSACAIPPLLSLGEPGGTSFKEAPRGVFGSHQLHVPAVEVQGLLSCSSLDPNSTPAPPAAPPAPNPSACADVKHAETPTSSSIWGQMKAFRDPAAARRHPERGQGCLRTTVLRSQPCPHPALCRVPALATSLSHAAGQHRPTLLLPPYSRTASPRGFTAAGEVLGPDLAGKWAKLCPSPSPKPPNSSPAPSPALKSHLKPAKVLAKRREESPLLSGAGLGLFLRPFLLLIRRAGREHALHKTKDSAQARDAASALPQARYSRRRCKHLP